MVMAPLLVVKVNCACTTAGSASSNSNGSSFIFSRCGDFSRIETWQKMARISPKRKCAFSKAGAYLWPKHPSKQPKTYCPIKVMSDLNESLKESYISKVGDALTPYAAELTTKGFDAATLIT